MPEENGSVGEFYDRQSLMYRVKYKYLDNAFLGDGKNNRYVLVFNLDLLVSNMHRRGYKELIDANASTEKINRAAVLGLINSMAHFNHYFCTRFGFHISVAFYFPSVQSYKDHESLCQIISQVCQFLPHMHFITQLPETKPLTQAHVMNALNWTNKKFLQKKNLNLKVLWFHPTIIDRISGFFCHCRELEKSYILDPKEENNNQTPDVLSSHKINSELFSTPNVLAPFWEDMSIDMKSQAYVPIISTRTRKINSFLNIKDGGFYKPLQSSYLSLLASREKIERLKVYADLFTEKGDLKDKDFAFKTHFQKDVQTPAGLDSYHRMVDLIDFKNRTDVISSVETFLPIWTKKLKDKSIAGSLTAYLSVDGVSLNIEWLLEGVSYA